MQIKQSTLGKHLTLRFLTLIVTLGMISSATYANPKGGSIRPILQKNAERCLISIDSDSARVSCEVDYYITYRKLKSEVERISIPSYWPSANDASLEHIEKSVAARIEANGHIYTPIQTFISTYEQDHKIEGATKIISLFSIKLAKEDRFKLIASYNQPLIKDIVYYLPSFEDGNSPADINRFTITFFSHAGNTLKLLTKHRGRSEEMHTRIQINPAENELIAVKMQHGHLSHP